MSEGGTPARQTFDVGPPSNDTVSVAQEPEESVVDVEKCMGERDHSSERGSSSLTAKVRQAHGLLQAVSAAPAKNLQPKGSTTIITAAR